MSTGRTKANKRAVSARALALEVLTRVEQDRAYSNLLLHQTLQKHSLERQDSALATEIVYGTIQRLNTIDYFLERFVAKGMSQLQIWVRNLLRLSFYQLYYLDRIPPHAVVNEAVNIAKQQGHQGISSLINGVLRNVIRQMEQLQIPENLEPAMRISLEYSHPQWMVERWIEQYGQQVTEQICAANNETPRTSIRVNTQRVSRDGFLKSLQQNNYNAEPSSLSPAGIIITGGGNMALTPWYAEGYYSVQDESSMLVADVVDPKPGMKILDCCAAPGGKTTHLAEIMHDEGEIWANDLHRQKVQLVEQQAKRLQHHSIKTITGDAKQLAGQFHTGTFDCILLDAPCSGLGVIRRKPEIKWAKTAREISDISIEQSELLEQVQRLVKPGGALIYSTCTIEREENQQVIRQFMDQHPEFTMDLSFPARVPQIAENKITEGMLQILPFDYGTDGFFIARLIKSAS